MTDGSRPRTAAVLGAGRMGAAIAAEYAAAGFDVRVTTSGDAIPPRLTAALAETRIPESALNRIEWRAGTAAACAGSAIVVESLPEDLELKRRELRLAQSVAPRAVLATNTSSLRVGEIGEALDDPTRLVATHYLHPPSAFRVVEVVPSPATSEDVVEDVLQILKILGKEPIRLRRDSPGFVINRLQFALLRESIALVGEGVISPADLDRIVASGLGRRWAGAGPFATVALGGESVFRRVAENVYPVLSRAEAPPETLAHRELTPSDLGRIRRERDRVLELLHSAP